MTYESIISDPAFGNFLIILAGLALIKLYEKICLLRAGRHRKNPSYIISNGSVKRKVDME